jgi:gluconate 2-dehydrogenase gamma chain
MSLDRREFVTSLSAALLAAATACRDAAEPGTMAHGPPADSPEPPRELKVLTADEAIELEAVTARIIPTDDSPGAKEAGCYWFIDHALNDFARDAQPLVREGLRDLGRAAARAHGRGTRFSALTGEQQDALLKAIERSEFFGFTRFATIAGFLALPKYGGNKDYVGWQVVGQDRGYEFTPPFGWYDRPEQQRAMLGRVL